jgi:hypothetical protein
MLIAADPGEDTTEQCPEKPGEARIDQDELNERNVVGNERTLPAGQV